MDISVEDISPVDKEIKISATRKDLDPKFNEAYKKYQSQINMPGFRPGKVPISIIKKRFGTEIEQEEIGKYVEEVFEKEVVPEYNPIGESQMIDLAWEDDELEAKFKIGSKPEFEIADLEQVEVDKLVHDVTDEEVQDEIDHQLENEGDWKEVEEPATEKSRVTVDASHLDEDGNPIEGETDKGQVIDLRKEDFKSFSDDLVGTEAGDEVDVELGPEGETEKFRLTVKKVEHVTKADLTDELAKKQTNGEAKNVDEYKALIKSRIQDYFDQVSDDLIKRDLVDSLVESHDFEVPEVFVEQIQNQYIERVKQKNGGELPPDFDAESYRNEMRDRAVRDAKWYFINEKLQEKFEDIEIKPDDIDEYLAEEAARYGVTVDQMRNLFAQNPQQLESLRNSIREEKVFDKLQDIVSINEISKEEYQEQYEKKLEEKKKAEEEPAEENKKKKFWNIFG